MKISVQKQATNFILARIVLISILVLKHETERQKFSFSSRRPRKTKSRGSKGLQLDVGDDVGADGEDNDDDGADGDEDNDRDQLEQCLAREFALD